MARVLERVELGLVGVAMVCAAFGCDTAPPLGRAEAAVVYGSDDRVEVYAHPDPMLRSLARDSVVALISTDRLDESDPSRIVFTADTLADSEALCEDQRFGDQPSAAYCSGTLIDQDLVLTAGHCVVSEEQCQERRFVFDFLLEAEGTLATIEAADVYGCERRVVVRRPGDDEDVLLDYAVVQLDRPAAGRARAQVRAAHDLVAGDALAVIGCPSGIPFKVDDGGSVIDTRASTRDFFLASTDTFNSNSGSGVFNAARELVGTLTGGQEDYVDRDGCNVVNVLPEPGPEDRAERVGYVSRAIDDLCASGWVSDLCGDTEGWCRPCSADAQCPAGWTCRARPERPSSSFCSAPCAGDADCREGHECTPDGCQPGLAAPTCFAAQPWTRDVCGRLIDLAEPCDDVSICVGDACVPAGPGNTCASATVIEPVSQEIRATTSPGYVDSYRSACGGLAADRVYQFTLPERTVVIAEASGFDTLLHVRSECADAATELRCNDDQRPSETDARLGLTLAAGTWFLFVDGFDERSSGDFVLSLTFGAPAGSDAGAGDAGDAGGDADGGATTSDGGCSATLSAGPHRDAGRTSGLVLLLTLVALRRRSRG